MSFKFESLGLSEEDGAEGGDPTAAGVVKEGSAQPQDDLANIENIDPTGLQRTPVRATSQGINCFVCFFTDVS